MAPITTTRRRIAAADLPAALEAAIARYQTTDDLVRLICEDAGISTATLFKALRGRGIPRRDMPPRTRFILPDGRTVGGLTAATAALGISHSMLYRRAAWDRDADAWRVREGRPAGRPRREGSND